VILGPVLHQLIIGAGDRRSCRIGLWVILLARDWGVRSAGVSGGQGESGNWKMLVLGFIEEHDWGEKNKTGLLGTYAG